MVCPSCGAAAPDDARFCPRCGAAFAAAGSGAGRSRRPVTVVFSDVVDSTALGERLDPETLRRVMERYFAQMRGALERHGGTVEKFIGDAVMAVFGMPTIHEDDALRAVRAADDMRHELRALNAELTRRLGRADRHAHRRQHRRGGRERGRRRLLRAGQPGEHGGPPGAGGRSRRDPAGSRHLPAGPRRGGRRTRRAARPQRHRRTGGADAPSRRARRRLRARPRCTQSRGGTGRGAGTAHPPVPARRRQPTMPAHHDPGRRRRGQDTAGRRTRRRARARRAGPARPVPALRRGHHLLPRGRSALPCAPASIPATIPTSVARSWPPCSAPTSRMRSRPSPKPSAWAAAPRRPSRPSGRSGARSSRWRANVPWSCSSTTSNGPSPPSWTWWSRWPIAPARSR